MFALPSPTMSDIVNLGLMTDGVSF
jgi:hypothetical protein